MDRIERIAAMEKKLDAADAALCALERALEGYAAALGEIGALEDYLSSAERRGDLLADESGLLPASLRRGVLSEDGICDLLERNDELRLRLRELAGRE